MSKVKVVLPPSTIGIIGGGQLGRMMAIAAKNMGYKIAVLEPGADSPLAQVADIEINAAYDDEAAITKLLEVSDVVTYEFENVPSKAIAKLKTIGNIPQGEQPLVITSHRLKEKLAIEGAGYKVAPFLGVTSSDELKLATKRIGYPCILKTCSGGYDGKGQWVLRSEDDMAKVMDVVNENEYVLEGFVNFSKEISVIVTRSVNGDVEAFPTFENVHHNQILHTTKMPADINAGLEREARAVAEGLMEKLDFFGTLAIEMFVTDEGIVINELAPRPHNSGHVTMDACSVSQFEQHIRAICGLPLVKAESVRPGIMVNLLGQHVEYGLDMWQKSDFSDAKLHLYGKEENKRDRKVGHLNFVGNEWVALEAKVDAFLKEFPE